MSFLEKLSLSDALHQWNNYTSLFKGIVPFSFNPSLFFFYQNHFGWKPYYFLLQSEGKVIGLLPLVNTNKAWVSLPHFSYGGIITEEKQLLKSRAINTVINNIEHLQMDAGFYSVDTDKLELDSKLLKRKLFIRSFDEQNDREYQESEKVTFLLYLKKDEQETFNVLSSNLKRKIRKAEKYDLIIRNGGLELLDDFYSVYTNNIKRLKSLNYAKSFFSDLLSMYKYGDIGFFVVYQNSKPVAGALTASYGSFYENMFFATLPKARKYYVSDWLHWQMIKFALNKSRKSPGVIYSFGRSTLDSSVYHYKKHWPVITIPLYVYSNINDIKKNKLAQKIWGILPGYITRYSGAKLIKHIY